MQQMNLKIDDKFFPHFKAIVDSFVKDNKVEIINDSSSFTLDSIDEVRKRVSDAEKRIADGNYVSNEDYESQMDKFFKEDLGVHR